MSRNLPRYDDSPEHAPTTIVFGATGFIGKHLFEDLRLLNPGTVGTARKQAAGLVPFDLARPDITPFSLSQKGISVAVIASAVTGIAICENDPKATHKINVDGTLELARQLYLEGLKVITFSSDYVFDGITGNYDESSTINPLNEYGRQKAEVETRLPEVCPGNHLVLRMSKVFALEKGKGTLLDEMAGKLIQQTAILAAKDQIFCPTYIGDVVNIVRRLAASGEIGLINVCSPEKISRLELAKRIAGALGVATGLITETSLDELGETFTRPKDTSLISKRIQSLKYEFMGLRTCIETVCRAYREHRDGN